MLTETKEGASLSNTLSVKIYKHRIKRKELIVPSDNKEYEALIRKINRKDYCVRRVPFRSDEVRNLQRGIESQVYEIKKKVDKKEITKKEFKAPSCKTLPSNIEMISVLYK